VIFISARNQRIGDLAAGTHVVRDRHGDRRVREPALAEIDSTPAQTWDASAVSSEDVAAVRSFLERRDGLRADARRALAAELASRLRPRVGGAPPDVGDARVLELRVAVKSRRCGRWPATGRPPA
jgi:hypothetical protein